MKFLETINNIWEIKDLRTRILITVLFVLIYRFGSFIVLPGINPEGLSELHTQTQEGLMSLLDMFSGGAFSNASIFALGIMPYISASIVIQLLTVAVPAFQKMQREGESGRRKITQYTRFLTVAILLFQGPSYLINLSVKMNGAMPETAWFYISSTIILCAGSMFVMWLGERITDKGVGNGISFIILVGIIARFPGALTQEVISCLFDKGGGGLIKFLLEFVFFLLVIGASVLLVQGVRQIPIQYAKQMIGTTKRAFGGARQYLPLKVNAANVMPIIFAQAIMFIPLVVAPFLSTDDNSILSTLLNPDHWPYNLLFAVLIILFTYFYTAITINPTQMAEDLKRNQGFIPGIKAGTDTADYIDDIMSKLTLPGSVFLALIAILPAVARFFDVSQQFAQFFGGTSLLIMVGVVLDTLQQIEGHLLSHNYDGLLKSGRIRGRSGYEAY
ncbi:MAG: preprotein translocase subunit SecY [Paludibacteraceae bacterium]|nr:preprotein translocase subunit SecY [Paludibacteraceae bacterium]MBR4841269.1 preprotein translocase subunit SecY [Paludibacteraceae bacterium]